MAEYKFPTEVVDLPSKGYFYVNGHPLSSGKVEIKYMTAKEEDILSSENLIRQGVVIDKLLEALIVDKDIKVDDLLTGDKNALMVASRILAYGKDYDFEYGGVEQKVDLTSLENKKIDFSGLTKGLNEFEFELPNSKRKIKFRLPNGRDEKLIDEEVKALKKVNSNVSAELTTRFKKTIISVDDNSEPKRIHIDRCKLGTASFNSNTRIAIRITMIPSPQLWRTSRLNNSNFSVYLLGIWQGELKSI